MDPIDRQIFIDFLKDKPIKDFGGIVWHHSATPDGLKSRNIGAIRTYHTSYRIDGEIVTKDVYDYRRAKKDGTLFLEPWENIGYHLLCERRANKIVWEFGRPFDQDGAHSGHKSSNRFNVTHLGFCCVGDFDKARPDIELWRTCLELTRIFKNYLEIPTESIIGHREVYGLLGVPAEKSCPGDNWSMRDFRSQL